MQKSPTSPSSRRSFIKKLSLGAIASAGFFKGPTILASKKYQWKMVTTWPKNFPGVGTGANELAATIEKLSAGRIEVKVFGAGELVPALGVFDAVSRGTVQMGHGSPYYWKGKHEATQFFSAVPFGFTPDEINAWILFGGGQKLWDELYAGFGLKPFLAGNTDIQMGGWFNKPINTPNDFKGLKMRIPGLGGDVLRELGTTVVTLPGGEIFQSLKTGAIDATEWVGPYNDLAFGFYKAAKYYYWPGWHEPGTAIEAMVNKKEFEALPKDLQQVIESACLSANSSMLSEFSARNGLALTTLVNKHKVELKRFPDDVLKTLAKTSQEVVKQIGAKDAFSKKVYESYEQFKSNASQWDKVATLGYPQARAIGFNLK